MARAGGLLAPRRRLRTFARATGGVAAIEFAFIAPILIFFYLGMAETCQLIMAQRRVSHAAAALSDLVTQDTAISVPEMFEVIEAGCTLMDPFPVHAQKIKIRLTSVYRHADTTTRVGWSENNRRGFTDPAADSPMTVSTPLGNAGDTVVMAEVSYDYKSSVGFLFNQKTLLHKAEMRPRRSASVAYPDNATGLVRMHCSS